MSRRSIALLACASLIATANIALVHAQTCANPIPILNLTKYGGNSCGANYLPALNHGTISTPGDDVVFRVIPGEDGVYTATLTVGSGQGPDALFLCRTPCGVNSECVDAAAVVSGVASVSFPQPMVGDYYLVVDSTLGSCGDYSLNLDGPLGRPAASVLKQAHGESGTPVGQTPLAPAER